jgi:hypothetical protein
MMQLTNLNKEISCEQLELFQIMVENGAKLDEIYNDGAEYHTVGR